MGGNALISIGIIPRRIESRLEFFDISKRAIDFLLNYYAIVEPCYELISKTSFGDIDILVSNQIKPFDIKNCVKNNYITSFEFEGVQVDAISILEEIIPLAKVVLFDDMGACIGRLFKYIGIKLCYDGLFTKNHNVLLSINPSDIFNFLGYKLDFPFYAQTQEELFEWLLSGYFNMNDCFDSELDAGIRKVERSNKYRNKRQTFIDFVDYTKNKSNHYFSKYNYKPLPKLSEALDFFGKTKRYNTIVDDKIKCEEINIIYKKSLITKI